MTPCRFWIHALPRPRQAVVVVFHGLTKKREVPLRQIDLALERKRKVVTDFERFTFRRE